MMDFWRNVRRMKKAVKSILRTLGYDIIKYSFATHPIARRMKLFEVYGIDAVIDVGANQGQYAQELRANGYSGRIISFEPLSSAFAKLKLNSSRDALWDAYNMALGSSDEHDEINIAGNSQSSSLLDMLPTHLEAAPESRYVGTERVEIKRLDSIFFSIAARSKHFCLKIDAQGFERRVLEGAENALRSIGTIQIEMSLSPLYRDGPLVNELTDLLRRKGYELVALEPGYADPRTGRLLQSDGIFHRFTL